MAKKAVKKRGEKYEPKLELKDGVQFDDLFKIAITDPKKKAAPAKKKK